MSQTDFNDLHVSQGLPAVREQLQAVIARALSVGPSPVPPSEPVPPAEYDAPPAEYDDAAYDAYMAASPVPPSDAPPDGSAPGAEYNLPPAPSGEEPAPALSIAGALQRFALAMPDGKVWDSMRQQLLKPTTAKAVMTKELYAQWLDSGEKRIVDQSDVIRSAQSAEKVGDSELSEALRRFVYLYPSTDVWDREIRDIVPVNALKVAIASIYDDWVGHPDRDEIRRDRLVFDPTQKADPVTHINMFRGLPLEPAASTDGSEAIQELVHFLCNGQMEVTAWLMKWLAWPLQNLGAKMATAVLMHSETQGSGKSLLFHGIMRPIYGEYGATLGQHQLESQYTDWRSNKLYGLFEEIFSRDQKYSHTGTVKHMVTGETHRIERKFVSGWEEANHMNACFLSNEIQPFPVEPTDRRMLVIWPEAKLPPDLQDRVVHAKDNGGINAFYKFLLGVDLSDFGPHTQPPMTDAKERLIDFGRSGWDTFYRDWERGRLEAPYCSCLVRELYDVYRRWCKAAGEKDLALNKFAGFLGTRLRHRKDVRWNSGTSVAKGSFFVVGREPDGKTQAQWLGESVTHFRQQLALSRSMGDGAGAPGMPE